MQEDRDEHRKWREWSDAMLERLRQFHPERDPNRRSDRAVPQIAPESEPPAPDPAPATTAAAPTPSSPAVNLRLPGGPRARAVVHAVLQDHDVTAVDLFSKKRNPTIVGARHDLCARLRAEKMSLTQIGNIVGRDHTTVLNSLRRVARNAQSPV